MNFRQIAVGFFFVLFVVSFSLAQNSQEVLAIAGNQSFTAYDLPPNVRQILENQKALADAGRRDELENTISDILLEEEAKFRKMTAYKLIEIEVTRKVPDPPAEQIKAVYDANRDQLGAVTLNEARPRILSFLRKEPEDKAMETLIANLKKKYKITPGVDINSPALKPIDVIATVGTRRIMADWFNEKAKPALYSNAVQIYRVIASSLENAVYSNLVLTEARNLRIEPEELIAREITNKMTEQTEDERNRMEGLLRQRLFKKYDARILLTPPEPPVQKISADDDPSQGNPKAPVTIVMFTDFQCSACSATHPVVKEVMQQYGDKVRLVVRDYPLTNIHANAQRAAEAAGAANAQGKFFEYIELLYKNQDALDDASLKKYATQVGLDRVKFDADLVKGAYAPEIAKDVEDGQFYGIRGTPTLFINGMRLAGNSADEMKRIIDKALGQKPSTNQ